MDTFTKVATQLRTIAAIIRHNPSAREAIAEGFELIAETMAPCVDCAATEHAADSLENEAGE